MTRRGRLVLASWACAVGACAGERPGEVAVDEAPAPIRASRLAIGLPNYYGASGQRAGRELARHLAAVLGIPVEVRWGEPYRELPQMFRGGSVQVAQLAPLPHVRLEATMPGLESIATPIISGSPTYLGHLYVRADSDLHTLSDLEGRRVAYVSKDSTSGYLFARDLLRRKGLDPDHFFGSATFYRSHARVLSALVSREVDVGAAYDATSDWMGPVERPAGLRVVAKTERIPNDCWVAARGLDPSLKAALRRALLTLGPSTRVGQVVLEGLHVNGWVAVDEARYERLRAAVEREGGADDERR